METEYMKETHITVKGNCVICGAPYENYGFATWGYWNESPSEYYLGEDKRCCKTCYEQKVMPARAERSRMEMENNQKENQ